MHEGTHHSGQLNRWGNEEGDTCLVLVVDVAIVILDVKHVIDLISRLQVIIIKQGVKATEILKEATAAGLP